MRNERLLIFLIMISGCSFGQSIQIDVPKDVQQYNIALLPADSAQAARYITTIAGTDVAMIQSVLPYSVVLVNHGSHRLLAARIGFKYIDVNDIPHMHSFGLSDFSGSISSQIATDHGRLFLMDRALNIYFARRAGPHPEKADTAVLSQSLDRIGKAQIALMSAQSVTACIDSVVIEGVGLVGPDTGQMRNHGWNRSSTDPH